MTKLEEVLAEEWTLSTDQGDEGDIFDAAKPREPCVMSAMGHESMLVPRARVAILGKRALSWMLACKACDRCILRVCPEHTIEFDAIVVAAKEIG